MKSFMKRHYKWIFPSLLFIILAASFLITEAGQNVMASAVARQLPIYCVEKSQNVCSLTFDAAWGNEDTQQLIDILGKYDITATFFVVGEWVDKYPESVLALHNAGHESFRRSSSYDRTKRAADNRKCYCLR